MSNFILYTRYTTPENLEECLEGKEHVFGLFPGLMDFTTQWRRWLNSFQLPENF